MVGIVITDQGALFEVEGGWGGVGEDQGLDGETRAVDAVLGYSWEGDVDTGAWGQNSGTFLFFSFFGFLWFFGHCRWAARHLGSAEANLQTQDYYKSGADEDYQMEPPESSVMRLQLCAEAWL